MSDVWQFWRDALAGEAWMPIAGYSLHEVSNFGRVRRRCKNGRHRILLGTKCPRGYVRVRLAAESRSHRVHRLVAAAFLEPDALRLDVNHKDGNPSNNHLDNLEWASPIENTRHAIRTGLRAKCAQPGTSNGAAKLTEEDVSGIRFFYQEGIKQADLGSLYGVSQRSISLIVRRETWSHIL